MFKTNLTHQLKYYVRIDSYKQRFDHAGNENVCEGFGPREKVVWDTWKISLQWWGCAEFWKYMNDLMRKRQNEETEGSAFLFTTAINQMLTNWLLTQ